jgi:phage tail-like protein
MSQHEFQHFIIKTATRWYQGFSESVRVRQGGSISLTPAQGVAAESGHITGMACDARNHLYAINALDCTIHAYSPKTQSLRRVVCFGGCGPGPGQFRFRSDTEEKLAGRLAIDGSMLYVADTYNHRVQVFDLPSLELLSIIGGDPGYRSLPSGERLTEFNEPTDISVDKKQNLYVLDHGNRRIAKFNRHGGFLRYIGAAGEHVVKQPESFAVVSASCDAKALVYVVGASHYTISVFDEKGTWLQDIGDFGDAGEQFEPAAVAVDRRMIIYVAQRGSPKIHQFDASGRYLGYLDLGTGWCSHLAVDRAGNLIGICEPDGRIVQFDSDREFAAEGTYYSREFDSTIIHCAWHRIELDVDLPEKTSVEVCCHISESSKQRRSILQDEWKSMLSTPQSTSQPKDALFPDVKGRYLRLRIVLRGDGFHTPLIRQARIFFQRLSYLRYLPATYQEDERGRDFLERFLSIFETMSFDMDERIAGITRYFDPQAIDGEFLSWLGGWLAVVSNENWTDAKKKELLKKAYQLYKWRGTAKGIREMVHLFTDGEVRVIEQYRLHPPLILGKMPPLGQSSVITGARTKRMVLDESSTLGDSVLTDAPDSPEMPFESEAFDFVILADTSKLNDAELAELRRLIEQEKPAHTRFALVTSEAFMELGLHSRVGVDTRLSRGYKPMRIGDTVRVGKDTFVGTRYCTKGTYGTRSRVAIDTVLH